MRNRKSTWDKTFFWGGRGVQITILCCRSDFSVLYNFESEDFIQEFESALFIQIRCCWTSYVLVMTYGRTEMMRWPQCGTAVADCVASLMHCCHSSKTLYQCITQLFAQLCLYQISFMPDDNGEQKLQRWKFRQETGAWQGLADSVGREWAMVRTWD